MRLAPLALLLALPTAAQDCNSNGIPDAVDLALGTSSDCNLNGVPDECEPCSQELFVADFEGLVEGTSIDNQYASIGLTFLPAGTPAILPVAATEGSPVIGFGSSLGEDTPLIGTGGLTDGIPAGDWTTPHPIEMALSPPVDALSMTVFDVEQTESVRLEAYAGAVLVATATVDASTPGAGDGTALVLGVSAPGITSARILPAADTNVVGFAIDNLTLMRSSGTCNGSIRVSQESAPGAGDFASNVLGSIDAPSVASSAASLYAYDFPCDTSYNGTTITTVDQRTNLFLVDSSDGLVLFLVHDKPKDESGGEAQVAVDFTGLASPASILVVDDPTDPYQDMFTEDGASFTANHSWGDCCTDGFVIGPVTGEGWSALVEWRATPGIWPNVIGGLSEWVAHGTGGVEVQLALQEGRRVLLEHVPPTPSCLAPLTVDTVTHSLSAGGSVNFSLQAGAHHAGELYLLVGSVTGTTPGFMVDGILVPLNVDAYTVLTLKRANQGPFKNTFGVLDGAGSAPGPVAIGPLPAGLDPSLAGLHLDHAYVTLTLAPKVVFASNAAPLDFVP